MSHLRLKLALTKFSSVHTVCTAPCYIAIKLYCKNFHSKYQKQKKNDVHIDKPERYAIAIVFIASNLLWLLSFSCSLASNCKAGI